MSSALSAAESNELSDMTPAQDRQAIPEQRANAIGGCAWTHHRPSSIATRQRFRSIALTFGNGSTAAARIAETLIFRAQSAGHGFDRKPARRLDQIGNRSTIFRRAPKKSCARNVVDSRRRGNNARPAPRFAAPEPL
jgi:hypothetical protein